MLTLRKMPVAQTPGVFDLVSLQKEQVAQLSAHTHTHVHTVTLASNEKAPNERWQTTSLAGGGGGGAWGSCWTAQAERCPRCVFCVCEWTKQKLIVKSLGSQSCWKGMPVCLVRLSASISHRRGCQAGGLLDPGPADRNSLILDLTYLNKTY